MTQTILSCYIAGVSHVEPDFDRLNAEDTVLLELEPTNPYDTKAVRCFHPVAGKLGYIPQESTLAIHEAFANGFTIRSRIVSIQFDRKTPRIKLVSSISL